ncbi:hypothetical protein AKJ57_03680 [candidate division MSBL1 archaeon SCGC-AAA259A05]|uniref:Transcription regulator PadR N-terminal domain-containing protein n=1 Tax=candidate division MSBL1 archaeon SCGC-AAA259A05 TaxID=1698259 RepID=A0A133U9B6_9EURY|nr:hypothetical protein AKJ57_03680 [candidate division MSBL1 archaeon SCGC-AAA259A05]
MANLEVWKRVLVVLRKSSLPDWFTVQELAKLSRKRNYGRVMTGEEIYWYKSSQSDPEVRNCQNYISRLIRNWKDQGFVREREREDNGKRGRNPKEYSLTEYGRKMAEKIVEETIEDKVTRRNVLS